MSRLTENTVNLRSTLLGLRSYNPQNGEVAAVLLRQAQVTTAAWELRLVGGSRLRARAVTLEGSNLRVEDTSIGWLQVPASMLREIISPAPDLEAGR